MWIQHFENRFKRDYKNLSLGIQEKVKDAIEILVNSDNPRKFGLHKTARYNCIHAYEIGRQYRILYNVYDKTILLNFSKSDYIIRFIEYQTTDGLEFVFHCPMNHLDK